METGNDDGQAAAATPWNFAPNDALLGLTALSVRGVLGRVKAGMVEDGARPVVPMGHGDPSVFPCFRTAPEAVDAVANALRSGEHNSYSPCVGLEPARRSESDTAEKTFFLAIFKLYAKSLLAKLSTSEEYYLLGLGASLSI
jgi:tyrosine aminotransferase